MASAVGSAISLAGLPAMSLGVRALGPRAPLVSGLIALACMLVLLAAHLELVRSRFTESAARATERPLTAG